MKKNHSKVDSATNIVITNARAAWLDQTMQPNMVNVMSPADWNKTWPSLFPPSYPLLLGGYWLAKGVGNEEDKSGLRRMYGQKVDRQGDER